MFFGMPPDYDPGVIPAIDATPLQRRVWCRPPAAGACGSKALLFAANVRSASNVLVAGASPAVQVPIDGSNSPTNS